MIVDQFEELFTLNPPEVQSRFAELLGVCQWKPMCVSFFPCGMISFFTVMSTRVPGTHLLGADSSSDPRRVRPCVARWSSRPSSVATVSKRNRSSKR